MHSIRWTAAAPPCPVPLLLGRWLLARTRLKKTAPKDPDPRRRICLRPSSRIANAISISTSAANTSRIPPFAVAAAGSHAAATPLDRYLTLGHRRQRQRLHDCDDHSPSRVAGGRRDAHGHQELPAANGRWSLPVWQGASQRRLADVPDHQELFTRPGKKHCSDVFVVGGFKWGVLIFPNLDAAELREPPLCMESGCSVQLDHCKPDPSEASNVERYCFSWVML